MDIHAVASMMSVKHQSMRKIIREAEDFPKVIILGERIKRWKQTEILEWINKKHESESVT